MLYKQINAFNNHLLPPTELPDEVEVLNPFSNPETEQLSSSFYQKFYNDTHTRTLIFGINPGRLGAGITGVPFTDPINLREYCGIDNSLNQKHELSSQYIYNVINSYGGVHAFYRDFLFTAVCPHGLVKEGKNINYYDSKKLEKALYSFIVESIKQQLTFGINTTYCICLGEGANFRFLNKLNNEHHFFEEILPLAHPRYILQYKRKQLNNYIDEYIKALKTTLKA